jgi:hypothetical protein
MYLKKIIHTFIKNSVEPVESGSKKVGSDDLEVPKIKITIYIYSMLIDVAIIRLRITELDLRYEGHYFYFFLYILSIDPLFLLIFFRMILK